jgi:hypothetical protein
LLLLFVVVVAAAAAATAVVLCEINATRRRPIFGFFQSNI